MNASKQQREALQAVVRAATQNKLFNKGGGVSKTVPGTQNSSPKNNIINSLHEDNVIKTARARGVANNNDDSNKVPLNLKSVENQNKPLSRKELFKVEENKSDQELGFTMPKLKPTSPNTSHLTHIKQKNVVKKFAFATRVGFEPDNPDKVN